MQIFVAQLNPVIGDLKGNTQKILQEIKRAKEKKSQLILFPELAFCGYPPEDLLFHQTFIKRIEESLQEIIEASKGLAVVVGVVRQKGIHLFNSAAVINDGKLLGYQDKWLLPTYDLFNERRYFEPGDKTSPWMIQGKKIGIVICEDVWSHAGHVAAHYKRDPIIALSEHALDCLLCLSASPYQYQKPDVRVSVCQQTAKKLNCPVIMCCQVGANGPIIFDGYSIYINQQNKLCQMGKGFKEDSMLIDLEEQNCLKPFVYHDKENLLEALILGVCDYFKKCQFSKACLGLSGGIDSALVAYIAKEALSQENVIGVKLPSRYTSDQSNEDAETLTKNLGIKTLTIPIEDPFASFLQLLEPYFEGKAVDRTEENLQARIRGTLLMALSNKHGYIVLSTGNKSELALGYSTLYGDMCGGLGVIADVVKTKVYELCRYINEKEQKEIIPHSILTKAPTAELKAGQKDLDSLPEYEIVDQVLQGYVEDYLSIEEIIDKHNLPQDVVEELVKRIHLAEYKRRQAPPILRVSKKSFGIGRHYPLVQRWI